MSVFDALPISSSPVQSFTKSPNNLSISSKIQRIVEYLLFKQEDLSGIYHTELAKHVFLKCRPYLFKEFAESIQKILNQFDLGSMDKKSELYLANIISLIPYCYPNRGDLFMIPFKNGRGEYAFSTFYVSDVLSLSLDASLTPLKAYGLSNRFGQHLLVFLGTTFPAAEGFINSLMTDFTPFVSVGKILFTLARQELMNYFSDRKQVVVYGKSLGGSLALHTFREFDTSIKKVYAVAPAGLLAWDGYKKESKKKVVIITQEGDLVSKLGYFPEHDQSQVFEVSLTTKKVPGVLAHVVAFSGAPCAKIKKIDPKLENRCTKRRIATAAHIAFSCLIFSFLVITVILHKARVTIFCGKNATVEKTKFTAAKLLAMKKN